MNQCARIIVGFLCLTLLINCLNVEGRTVGLTDEDFNDLLQEDPESDNLEKRAIITRHQALREYCILRGSFDYRCSIFRRPNKIVHTSG